VKKRHAVWALLATLVVLSLSGCAMLEHALHLNLNHANDYGAATKRYVDRTAALKKARYVVVEPVPVAPGATETFDQQRKGVTTATQYNEFHALDTNITTLDSFAFADLETWRKTNVKPADFTPHMKALEAAEDKLIAFVGALRP
jgi:hypothetical protein